MIKFTSIFADIYGRVIHNRSGEIKILWTLKEGSFLNLSVGHSHSYFLLGLINLPESAESIFLGYPTVSANPSPHSSGFFSLWEVTFQLVIVHCMYIHIYNPPSALTLHQTLRHIWSRCRMATLSRSCLSCGFYLAMMSSVNSPWSFFISFLFMYLFFFFQLCYQKIGLQGVVKV